MRGTANHIIHKQTIDIRFSDFTTAHSWDAAKQAKTAEAVHKSIEQCFRHYDSSKEYLTIDRLELDLGAFSTEQLLSKMPEKLYGELQKILSSYRMDLTDLEEAEIIEDVSSINIWSAPGADTGMVSPIVKNSEVTAFLFFLQHGNLPWWYSNDPAWDPEWVKKLTVENWQELRNFLTACFEKDVYYENALIRLMAQFSDGFLASLLNGLQRKEPVEKAWNWLTRFYKMLQNAKTGSFPNESPIASLSVLRRHFWKNWIRYAVGRSAVPELAALFALIKQPSLITYCLSGIEKNSEWMDSLPEFWQSELISLKQEEHKRKTESIGLKQEDHKRKTELISLKQEEHKRKTELSVSSELVNHAESEKLKEPDKASHIDKEDFILVPDAGLVLLHPFLQRLYENCHWLNKNEFVNDEVRNRAVNALHYLAAGDDEAPEYVLMLPKLLCGILPARPLEPSLPLTDAEKAVCDELLDQVIGHWSALRNTSPATLRETFLRRQGKLFLTDKGWRLEVQRKTEDILLNRLPWGFSMIKFSWMPLLLSVSWE